MQALRVLRYMMPKNKHMSAQRFYASKKVTYPKITLNDIPSPEGDFYSQTNALQRTYNVHLVVGIGVLTLTLAFGFATNMFEAFQDIPEVPENIECYKGSP